jgi:hypothetical protein
MDGAPVILTLLLACGEKDELDTAGDSADTSDTSDSAVDTGTSGDAVGECSVSSNDAFELNSAVVSGDTLTLSVSYSGGCEDHVFEACWDGLFQETAPETVVLDIGHDAKSDACEAYPTEDRSFDLGLLKSRYQALTGQTTGVLTLDVDGQQSVTYSW